MASSLEGKRAAIVEDEGITQLQLRKILSRAGMQVVGSATNAEAGIDLAMKERPDIVLMDINMPGELDGLDAAERIVPVFHPCVVIITAYEVEEYRDRASRIPTCGYVIKPVTSEILIPALERAYSAWTKTAGGGDLC